MKLFFGRLRPCLHDEHISDDFLVSEPDLFWHKNADPSVPGVHGSAVQYRGMHCSAVQCSAIQCSNAD